MDELKKLKKLDKLEKEEQVKKLFLACKTKNPEGARQNSNGVHTRYEVNL